jgi:hypothetical protein
VAINCCTARHANSQDTRKGVIAANRADMQQRNTPNDMKLTAAQYTQAKSEKTQVHSWRFVLPSTLTGMMP